MSTLSANRRTSGAAPTAAGPVANGICLHIPRTAFTLDGFRAWVESEEFPEKLRVTFFDGEIYLDMSKEELETHAMVKAEVCRVLMNLIRLLTLGEFYLDGVLVTNEAAGVSNNPDATFVSWASLERGLVRWIPSARHRGQFMEIEGRPDWLLEIVSGSSVRKDTAVLRAAYHLARIPEYWLVDARGREILFRIFHWRKTGYAAARSRDGWQRSRTFGREFRLVREAGRLGLWEYTLQMQPE